MYRCDGCSSLPEEERPVFYSRSAQRTHARKEHGEGGGGGGGALFVRVGGTDLRCAVCDLPVRRETEAVYKHLRTHG